MTDLQPALYPDLIMPDTTDKTIEEQFNEFMDANPWVLRWFTSHALHLVDVGHKRIGINMLREVFRYESMLGTDDPNSTYKINNNYAPYLARRLAAADPRLADVFEFRRSRADETETA